MKSGRPKEAMVSLVDLEKLACTEDLKDAKLEAYRMLSDCYKELKVPAKSIEYHEKYFNLKDTLLNYRQLMSISEIRFLNDIKSLSDEITEMNYRHRIMSVQQLASVIVLIVVLVFVFLLYMKNRQLNIQNKMLYKKNGEILKSEENERSMRKKLEELLSSEPDANAHDADKPLPYIDTCKIEDVDGIYNRVLSIMENNESIFQPDFTAESLASLVGEKQRNVSQVLKKKTGKDFYSLLREYRIKEACKRFHDREHYGNLTIEAVAYSVGFKSRPNFVSAFKAIVGLKPSEYLKMLKEDI